MSKSIKFIHTADVHLGKKLSCNSSKNSKVKDIFINATEQAFKNLVELAVAEEIDFILIAGDLYDREARSIKSSRFFLKQCQYLNENEIKIYIISGNHDPAGIENEVFELPENVHYFSSEKVETIKYKKDNKLAARIIGQSYRQKFENRTMYNYYTAPDKSVFNIALLHTALNKDNNRYVPVNKSELLTKNEIHYWALGHLHQYQKLSQDPSINFPGALQSHNISEQGSKGAILVEVDSNLKIKENFVPLSPIIFKEIVVDLERENELDNITKLQQLINEKLEKQFNNIKINNKSRKYKIKAAVIRLNIVGRTPVHQYVADNREELEETLLEDMRIKFSRESPSLWLHSLILRTAKPLKNLEELKKSSQLYQNINQLINDLLTDNELNQELLAEWGQIWQGDENAEDRSNYRFYADSKLQKNILEEVEKIIISELIEGGD
ncbi:DNA double-strand break repair protein Mre11 [Halanaerobium saccharolyticum subsp. saccharolyticum DSM 6643]|uniref:DNA double-strand break repair protein Mre11 n=1 Tax=Halanaerobium saccharolyticum subsp. saccharolyticum DSM 6643 TaxID=1293054 RepID=M5E4Z5_9FIRM|nr:DNA repair exonuclease [Halanaerobium saccharolyticum]CCU81158.1 DNA double-strand break repair protein Mre11 [Halanaerobium saccharolyticum subsp. saccharolyticum DSM 6643]